MTAAPDKAHAYRFTFAQTAGAANPWTLLTTPQPDDTVPVIADDNTATYILHLAVGQSLDVPDVAGRTRRLKLVATLSNSVFQSELLMAESSFRQLFPAQDGFGVVLVDCPKCKQPRKSAEALNTQLNEFAVDVEPTAQRLAQFLEIQNTYLSTFQALGALGLMLGTVGLAVVLVRTVLERKAELALLASIGFRKSDRLRLVLSENVFLLVLGLVAGTLCAVIGIIPAVARSSAGINVGSLAATLARGAVDRDRLLVAGGLDERRFLTSPRPISAGSRRQRPPLTAKRHGARECDGGRGGGFGKGCSARNRGRPQVRIQREQKCLKTAALVNLALS